MTTAIICSIVALACYWILIFSNHRLRQLNELLSNKNIELMVEVSKLEYDLSKARACRKKCEKAKLLQSNKKRYLDYVYLTDDEYNKLLELFWKEKLNRELLKLNEYIGSKWVKYESHYHTIRNWNQDFIATKQPSLFTPKAPKTKVNVNKDKIIFMYKQAWKDVYEIADSIGCGKDWIRKALIRWGVYKWTKYV